MKRQITILGVSLIALIIMASSVGLASESEDLELRSFKVKLKPEGIAPQSANGNVQFKVKQQPAKIQKIMATVIVNKFKPKAGKVFQVWFQDTDKQGPHADSVMAFQTDKRGHRERAITTYLPDFSRFDTVIVTLEKQADKDPRPSNNEIVFRGKLN